MTVQFTPDNLKKLEDIKSRYPTTQAALLPTLWLAQDQFKVLTLPVLEYVAGLLNLSPAHVYSVATFYTMYQLSPVGRHKIQICRTLSCALMGADNLMDHLKGKLRIEEGETTQDGRFSLCAVECLASCGTAPAMMINEKYYENLTPKKVDEILNGLK